MCRHGSRTRTRTRARTHARAVGAPTGAVAAARITFHKGEAMKEIVADAELVAYCGLYCGACGSYRQGRCPGCHENAKATWCKVRSCVIQHKYLSCADCATHREPMTCKYFNNVFAKFFALVFRSDRAACIRQIAQLGVRGHAENMAVLKQMTMKK
jgi:hypothetical protein